MLALAEDKLHRITAMMESRIRRTKYHVQNRYTQAEISPYPRGSRNEIEDGG